MYKIYGEDELNIRQHSLLSGGDVIVWRVDFIPPEDPVSSRLIAALQESLPVPSTLSCGISSDDVLNGAGDVVGAINGLAYITLAIPQNAPYMVRFVRSLATDAFIKAVYEQAEQDRANIARASKVIELAGSLDPNRLKRGELKRLARAALDATLTAAGIKNETGKEDN